MKVLEELIKLFVKWAQEDKRYPLLFLFLIPGAYLFVKEYFKIPSFRETLNHETFLIASGIILIASGVLFVFEKRKYVKAVFGGVSLAFLGSLALSYGIYLIVPPEIPDRPLIVSIVEFQPDTPMVENEAVEIQSRLYQILSDRKKEGAPLEANKLKRRISFSKEEEGEVMARKIGNSRRGCAHLVVWGMVSKTTHDQLMTPFVTVVRQLENVEIIEPKLTHFKGKDIEFQERASEQIADVVSYVCGVAYYKSEDWEHAKEYFAQLNFYEGIIMYGMSLYMMGEMEKSLTVFQKAASIEPEQIAPYNAMGMVYLKLNNWDMSRNYFEKALSIDRNNFAALNNLGITYMQLGDYKKAAENLQKALEQKRNPVILSNLAFCLFETDALNEAVRQWKASLELFSKGSQYPGINADIQDARAGLAVGYFSTGKVEEAKQLYEQVLEENGAYGSVEKLETDCYWPPKARSKASGLIEELNRNSVRKPIVNNKDQRI